MKGTLTCGMPAAFAGGRRNVSLGRSVSSAWVSSHVGGRTGDSRCPLEERGGERRQRAPSARTHRGRRLKSASANEDTSFTRSRDPCTSIVTELSRYGASRMAGGGAAVKISRSGKLTQVGETGTGVLVDGRMRGSPRVTASRGNSRRSCVMRKKRKVVMAIVPARKRGPRSQCPYVVFSCRSRQAASWLRISSYAALSKRVAVRVNGGLARNGRRRESVAESLEQNDGWRVGLHTHSEVVKDRLRPRTT